MFTIDEIQEPSYLVRELADEGMTSRKRNLLARDSRVT